MRHREGRNDKATAMVICEFSAIFDGIAQGTDDTISLATVLK